MFEVIDLEKIIEKHIGQSQFIKLEWVTWYE